MICCASCGTERPDEDIVARVGEFSYCRQCDEELSSIQVRKCAHPSWRYVDVGAVVCCGCGLVSVEGATETPRPVDFGEEP